MITTFGILLSVTALLAFLYINYDRIFRRFIGWYYSPEIYLGVDVGDEIFYSGETVLCTDLQHFDDVLMFGIAIGNGDSVDIDIEFTVATGLSIQPMPKYYDSPSDFTTEYSSETVFHGLDGQPAKRYRFKRVTYPPKSYSRSVNFILELDPETQKVFKSTSVELIASVWVDSTTFNLPFASRIFDRVGMVQAETIKQRYTILGPHHESVDTADLSPEETGKEIEIENPNGYLLDEDGKVVTRFAGWKPGTHRVNEAVDSVKYINDRTELDRPVHPYYKPDPRPPPWESD